MNAHVTDAPPDVTIAICTYNRSGLLRQTLTSLCALQIPPTTRWEVIVVDNNSTDDTRDAVLEFQGRLPLRYEFEGRQGRPIALNRSIELCRSDLLIWTDDDVLVGQDWLGAFVRGATKYPHAAVFGGPVVPWFPVTPREELVEAFPVIRTGFCGVDYGLPEGEADAPYRAHGVNMAARLSRLNGTRYREGLGPTGTQWMGDDDTTFVEETRRRGGVFVWLPAMTLQHYVDPARFKLSYLRGFYIGVGLTWIRNHGVPPGRQVLGAPIWMWRLWLTHGVQHLLVRPFSKVGSLTHRREFWRLRGAIRASRERSARRASQG